MTIEQLQEENDKLQARLKKAIQVFSEQKKTIEDLKTDKTTLTTENDKLKSKIVELESKITEFEKNDDKFFDQIAEIDKINEELKSSKSDCKQLAEENSSLNDKLVDMITKHKEEKENYIAQINKKDEFISKAMDKVNTVLKESMDSIVGFYDDVQKLHSTYKK